MIHKDRSLSSNTLASGTLQSTPGIYPPWWGPPPGPATHSWGDISLSGGEESIDYSNGRSQWNYCSHSKLTWNVLPTRVNYRFYENDPSPTLYHDFSGFPLIAAVDVGAVQGQLSALHDSTPWNVDMEQSAGEALQSILPQINQAVDESMVNFLIDAKKLGGLRKQSSRILKTVADVQRLVLAARKGGKFGSLAKQTFKGVIRSLSQAQLINQYVLKTTYDDVRGIYRALRTVRAELDKLTSNANRPIYRRARRDLSTPSVSTSTDLTASWNHPWPYWQNGSWGSRSTTSYPRARLSVHAWFTYTVPEMNPRVREAAALLDMLGVHPDPRIIWDALRYSFVVDWVLRVGDFLGQFERPWLKPVVVLHQCWYSLERIKRCTAECWKTGTPNGDTNTPIASVPIIQLEHETYVRAPLNSGYLGLNSSGLSAYEILMGSALFGARLK